MQKSKIICNIILHYLIIANTTAFLHKNNFLKCKTLHAFFFIYILLLDMSTIIQYHFDLLLSCLVKRPMSGTKSVQNRRT